MDRPRTRGECEGGLRPCPWIGCRHHLLFEVRASGALQSTGLRRRRGRKPTVRRPTPDQERAFLVSAVRRILSSPETCSLDVAARGPLELEDVARLMGLTPRRVSQIEERILVLLRASDDPIVRHLADAAADAGVIDHPEEETVTKTKTSEILHHEAAIRDAHRARREGTMTPEQAARTVYNHGRELREAKKKAGW